MGCREEGGTSVMVPLVISTPVSYLLSLLCLSLPPPSHPPQLSAPPATLLFCQPSFCLLTCHKRDGAASHIYFADHMIARVCTARWGQQKVASKGQQLLWQPWHGKAVLLGTQE